MVNNAIKMIIFTLIVSSVQAGTAQIKVIYGDDDRVDVADSANPMYVKLAMSTAAMIKHSDLQEHNAEQMIIAGGSLEDDMGVCSHERFAKQPAAANCSGFLVGPKTLVTAGHCIERSLDCSNYSWVFDYKADRESQSEVVVDKSDVYKCVSIVSQQLDEATKNDYAVIELDREVTDREALKYRRSGKPQAGDELVVIGHPSGLPTKIADGANVRSVNDIFLVANLDTYGGNSGSAVFNANTGVVEGILVRGENDYVWSQKNCRISNRVGNTQGRGEDVTLMSSVQGLPAVGEEVAEEEEVVVAPVPGPSPRPAPDSQDSFIEWLLRMLFG